MTVIARLKVTLRDVKTKVVRQIEVPVDLRLDRLHQVLQAALGWTDSHLHEFRAGDKAWGRPDPDGLYEGPLPETKAKLQDLLDAGGGKTFRYIYDFGDDWDHEVRVERLGDAEPGVIYPRLLKAEGRCPPEDVGGPWGYAEFLEALIDPDHEQHEELLDWHSGPFDPQDAKPDRLARDVAKLAQRWAPKPRKPKTASKSVH
jgi:hypothetical protein